MDSFDPNNAEKDVCESLDSRLLCAPLSNGDALCRPYNWAVEDVMETINNTRHIIGQLKRELRVKVNIKRYMKDRGFGGSVSLDNSTQAKSLFLFFLQNFSIFQILVKLYKKWCNNLVKTTF